MSWETKTQENAKSKSRKRPFQKPRRLLVASIRRLRASCLRQQTSLNSAVREASVCGSTAFRIAPDNTRLTRRPSRLCPASHLRLQRALTIYKQNCGLTAARSLKENRRLLRLITSNIHSSRFVFLYTGETHGHCAHPAASSAPVSRLPRQRRRRTSPWL